MNFIDNIKTGNPHKYGPIFIVGMNGSGTTMLADCLNHHPDIFIFPFETRIIPHFLSKISVYGDLSKIENRHRLAKLLGKCRAYWEANGRRYVTLDKDDLEELGVKGVFNSLYNYFAIQEGKIRWGDKTPMYLQHMPLIKRYISDAKFIHIYRDGRDVARSFNRRFGYNPLHTIFRWKKVVRMGREDGKKLGVNHYMEIRYEDITSYPEYYMKKICEFLEIEFHRDMLKSNMPYLKKSVNEKKIGTIVQNTGQWRVYFNQDRVKKLEQIAGQYLAQLGYAADTSNGEYDPPKWKLRWWIITDRLKITLAYLKKNGIFTIKPLIRRAKESIIQLKNSRY